MTWRVNFLRGKDVQKQLARTSLKAHGFDTLETKASKVSNLKCGWRCQGIFDTSESLFEPLARKKLLYEKPTVVSVFASLALRMDLRLRRLFGTNHRILFQRVVVKRKALIAMLDVDI